jgi:putative ABC transport system permease protein
MSIDRRLRELALLQIAGFGPAGVRAMILGEAVVVGTIAIAFGTPLGVVVSRYFLDFFTNVTSTVVGIGLQPAEFGLSSLLVAVAVGLGASLAAVIRPASRASKVRPLDVFEDRTPIPLGGRAATTTAVALLLIVGAAWFSTELPAYLRLAVVSFGSLYLVAIVASRSLAPARRAVAPIVDAVLPRIGDLFGASLVSRPERSAYTVTAISAIVASSLAIAGTVQTVTTTVDTWFDAQFPNAIRVVAGSPFGLHREPLRPESVEHVASIDGIRAMARLKTAVARFQGDSVFVSGREVSTPRRPQQALAGRSSDHQHLCSEVCGAGR